MVVRDCGLIHHVVKTQSLLLKAQWADEIANFVYKFRASISCTKKWPSRRQCDGPKLYVLKVQWDKVDATSQMFGSYEEDVKIIWRIVRRMMMRPIVDVKKRETIAYEMLVYAVSTKAPSLAQFRCTV